MQREPGPPSAVEDALARGFAVVTANQRVARMLRHAYDQRQRALGCTSWQPPAVLAWESWTAALWRRLLVEGRAAALLLNTAQEHIVWRELLAADPQASETVSGRRQLDSLAELATRAWAVLHAYRGRGRLAAYAGTTDTLAFARWAAEFDRRAKRANWLTTAELPEALRRAVAESSLRLAEPGILLVGFDLKTPAQQALLDELAAVGIAIEEHAPEPRREAQLVSTATHQDELAACARWLRERLTEDPAARLAVIVPDLEADRAALDRALREELAPELAAIDAPVATGPYEFSLGVPLAQTPLGAAALDLLRWATAPLPLDRVSALLLSPHFARAGNAAGAEYLARAEFDAFILRRQMLLQPVVSIEALYSLAADSRVNAKLPILLRYLRVLRGAAGELDVTASRTHAEQAATMHKLLEAAGWSNAAHDSSAEYQARRRWESAFDELASLDFDGRRVGLAEALGELGRIATETLFAPESRHAPVQVLGPLEAAGSTFDAVWFLGAGDLAWPRTPPPNPLLGWGLQHELGMPGVDPARDLAQARRIMERIAASAPMAVFSYAAQTPDGHQRRSTALAGLALTQFEAVVQDADEVDLALQRIALEELHDGPVPPPPQRVEGGASILSAQAACGFRAFAERRLFASSLDSREIGLDPAERGTLVHKALEHLWRELGSQATLKALEPTEREAILMRAIDHALERYEHRAAEGWGRTYLDAERERLRRLLAAWLVFEAKRTPFSIAALERKLHDAPVGPLLLEVRVDRIDHVLNEKGEPAGELILDYKTGTAHPNDWLGDRPDEPQLPLYAVVAESAAVIEPDKPDGTKLPLAGVAFASVRTGSNVGLNGYAAEDGVLHKPARMKTESLDEQVAQWHEVLTALAEDFYSGRASVAPKQYPKTCRNCEQRLLCRLDPGLLQADVLEDYVENDAESAAEAGRG